MRRPVHLHFVSYRDGDETRLIPATSGEIEPMPNGETYEVSWLLPEGGARSILIATEELESLLDRRQIIYAD